MKQLVILPLLIPLATALLQLFAWRKRRIQRVLGICGTGALLAAGILLLTAVRREGILSLQAGGWPAPYGITLAADLLSAIMVVTAGLSGLAVTIYSLASTDIEHETLGHHPLVQVLLLGVCGSFLTGDLFNLYVWFEVMLIASFALLALGSHRGQMEGAVKYVALNFTASAFFLAGIAILYGVTGTLNLADLALLSRVQSPGGPMAATATLFLVAFGIKAAVFPLFFWLPASYHTPPVAVSTLFSAMLTKAGVYMLIRVFTLLFVHDREYIQNLILIAAGLTMVTGVLGAVAQHEFRRLLSFHIVSQIGYLLMGLGLFSAAALAGAIFFMVHVIVAKAALFLVSGIVLRVAGHHDLKKLGGLYESNPALSAHFLIPALSLAGIPPLSGFWGKLALVRAGIEGGQYLIVTTALAVSLLTLFSMTKIWQEAFWKERPAEAAPSRRHTLPSEARLLLMGPTAALALFTVVLGAAAGPALLLADEAAAQLMNPDGYINAVLGKSP
ncbi:Na+/H+ antiporter subunit D [Geobacter sp. DSM 9736]|uniref:Na+/H+ antiporter subunit D n=1 Tax=Geobacter sp. DSM 9736 TaxID=1277350 RepID=UPI000B512902|nr:Na+/H+ antiporter subunit D [Geobacter sp. DSM 9736]SNB46891.1 multisubunit sodium/proton antiporter, MrpD subunit [Geobacter sp. DSM 9736]